ncbi:MAG: histidine kinase [Bacteroidota bacterium]
MKKENFKTNLILIILFLFSGVVFGQNYDEKGNVLPEYTKTFSVKGKTLKVEIQNYPLFIGVDNIVKISCSDVNMLNRACFTVTSHIMKVDGFSGEKVFSIKPLENKIDIFRINTADTTINIPLEVSDLPIPTLYLDVNNKFVLIRNNPSNWELKAECMGIPCKIRTFGVIVKNSIDNTNGITLNMSNKAEREWGGKFSNEQKKIITGLENGHDFFISSAIVEMPNGLLRELDTKKFKIVQSELFSQVWGNFNRDLSSPLMITKLYSDLRLKIEGNYSKQQMDSINLFINEINPLLNGINVKLVDCFPSVLFTQRENYYSAPYMKGEFFYPEVMLKTEDELSVSDNSKIDLDRLFNQILWKLGVLTDDNVQFNKQFFLTPICKEYLIKLYSKNGLELIHKELELQNPKDFEKDYTLIVVSISLILFMVFKELLALTSLGRNILKGKKALWLKLILTMLVSLIPLTIVLVIQHFNGVEMTMKYIINAKLYFFAFSFIIGIKLWILDKIQERIKSFAVRLLVDFVLVVFIFWSAYQFIFFATHLDYVRFEMLHWEWIYIPLTVAIYRIYSMYNQRKIDELMREKELEVSKQKELTTKAELLALQSRINPHFLYNSLNSIASLAAVNASKTEQMAVNLAKLFRYNLNKGNELMTTVKQELEMVKVFLDIEKQRFGERLDYQVEVPEALMNLQIPTFLLQPLVENAIKHGISKITERGIIKIKIEQENNNIFIKVFDNGPCFENELITGYGLQNIFDKLTMVYKENYTMRFVNEDDKHIEIKLIVK